MEDKRHHKGIASTFSSEEVNKMYAVLGAKVLGMFRSKQEIEMFTPGELVEIFFRENLYEIRMHNIAPEKITGVQRIKTEKKAFAS